MERGRAVVGDAGLMPLLLEQASRDALIDEVVLDQEDAQTAVDRALALLGNATRRRFFRDRLLRGAAQPRREVEGAAAADVALDADHAVHQADELAGDRQPEAGAAVPARRRAGGLF